MAVFPDHIVLKNTTDSDAATRTALAVGQPSGLVPGEVCVRRFAQGAALYTLDSAGSVIAISSGASTLDGLSDVLIYDGKAWATKKTSFIGGSADADKWYQQDTTNFQVSRYGPASEDRFTWLNSWVAGDEIEIYLGGTLQGTYILASVDKTRLNSATYYAMLFTLASAAPTLGSGSLTIRNKNRGATALVNGDVLKWNSTLSQWVPGASSVVAALDDLTDVAITSPANGNYLKYNGTQWVNTATTAYDVAMDGGNFDTGLTDNTTTIFDQFPISINAHSDVDTATTPPASGQVLAWNGTNWVPGAAPASNLDALTDVVITTPASAQVLRYNGTSWVNAALGWADISGKPTFATVATTGAYADLTGKPSIPSVINDLADVDTTTTAPTNNQVLAWNGTNWVPANQSGGGGGGSVQSAFTSETETASGGLATFNSIGQSGQLVQVSSDLAAWIVLYPTAAARTADAGRPYGTDPAPGSGVLAEFYVTAGNTVLATPGTTYFNNDTVKANAIYAAVRSQAGAAVNAAVTVSCYAAGNPIGYRATVSGTTASLANGAAGNLTISGTGRSGKLISVETDRAAWVTLYHSTSVRTADASRPETTDPVAGSGVLAEVITTGAQKVTLTPSLGYFNAESTPLAEVYAKVVNKSGSTSTVQVQLTIVPAES